MKNNLRLTFVLSAALTAVSALFQPGFDLGACAAESRELIRDPHFQRGFYLLEPKPGNRVV